MVMAVVFDFDGLILDTDTPIFRSWAEAYDECGVAPLAMDEWAAAIGTVSRKGLDDVIREQYGHGWRSGWASLCSA